MDFEKMIQSVLDNPANIISETSKDMLITIQRGIKLRQCNVLSVLEENYQAQIAGYYNVDTTDEERKIRNAVIEEYQNLISIYKHRQ